MNKKKIILLGADILLLAVLIFGSVDEAFCSGIS